MKLFQGEPIKPCVDKLMEALSTTPGEVHMHKDIAHAAGVEYPSNRYRSLIDAWRNRLMREKNVDIDNVHDIGYRVLEENERVSVGLGDFRRSVGRMVKSVERVGSAETAKLDDTRRRQQDHAVRLGTELAKQGRSASKQIATIAKVQVLPRPQKTGGE